MQEDKGIYYTIEEFENCLKLCRGGGELVPYYTIEEFENCLKLNINKISWSSHYTIEEFKYY
ncbi:hypothetical protein [Helicobacter sp. 12S02634-8]|uniref:hypothetical protein n=1 Tax=Helicobacter sp. 12S02634-8 TaxID=1476199 RepID=UPI00117A28A2|nr:hypothetical protein [Helicobacter sp. 12S02634-8]